MTGTDLYTGKKMEAVGMDSQNEAREELEIDE